MMRLEWMRNGKHTKNKTISTERTAKENRREGGRKEEENM
jgi:hypothetical protein